MTVTPMTLINSMYAPNAQTTEYTTPAATTTIVDKFTVTNVTAGAVTIAINLVPSGGTAGNSNLIYSQSIAANTTVDLTMLQNQILSTGDFISVLAGAATSIVIRASGRQVA